MRWMHHLGLDYLRYSKVLYGHERADVVEYRDAVLQRMSDHAEYFFQCDGENMVDVTSPWLPSHQRP